MSSILVADKEVLSVEAVVRAAGRAGQRVVVAESGVEALERFRSDLPRVVFVDRLLPVLDGPHVCAKIRDSAAGSVSAVILTGVVLGADARLLRERYQFSDVLAKPFTAEDALRVMLPFLAHADEPQGRAQGLGEGEGNAVRDRPVAHILVDVVARRRTGELLWSDGRLVKSVFFAGGRMVAGRSNGRRDLWPAWAQRDPLIPPDERSRLGALGVPGPGPEGWTLYLREHGGLSTAEYRASRGRWMVSLLLELIETATGQVTFRESATTPDPLPPIDVKSLVFAGMRRASGPPFEALLPRSRCVLSRASTEVRPDELGLTQIEQELLGLIDGQHTLGELLGLGRLIQHELRPFLHALLTLGVAEPAAGDAAPPPPAGSDPGSDANVSRLPRTGEIRHIALPALLAEIHAAAESGILQVRSSTLQSSIHILAGEVVFARSNRREHRLGQVLIRTCKLSAEDHRRALALQSVQPGRRLGALLTSLGALTLRELHAGLQEQVQSVARDSLLASDGSYAFIAGELPADDMVSLAVSTLELVVTAARALAALRGDATLSGTGYLVPGNGHERARGHRALTTAEAAILAAADGRAVAAVEPIPGIAPGEAGVALATLLLAGWVGIAPLPPRPGIIESQATPIENPPAAEGVSVQLAGLQALNQDLEARLQALTQENRRLRRMLSTSATLNLA